MKRPLFIFGVWLMGWILGLAVLSGSRPSLALEEVFPESAVFQTVPDLVSVYRKLHAHPELSAQEVETSKYLADRLKQLGMTVHHPLASTGVLGVLKNGEGPLVLYRTELDALPIPEETTVAYRSERKAETSQGSSPVMHACGHDLHMATWVGVAHTLIAFKEHWKGTVAFLGQPAEETGKGAQWLIDQKLFDRIPKPTAILSLHVSSDLPIGTVSVSPGVFSAAVGSLTLRVIGQGGHAALPAQSKNPILFAADLIQALHQHFQDPSNNNQRVVVTIFQSGVKKNIIPDVAELGISVRALSESQYQQALQQIASVADSLAKKRGFRVDLNPSKTVTPPGINDATLTPSVIQALKALYGPASVTDSPPHFFGDDFSRYSPASGAPSVMLGVGSLSKSRLEALSAAGLSPPPLHSPRFLPEAEAALPRHVHMMAHLIFHLLGSK
jgi:hippurate hydrolase